MFDLKIDDRVKPHEDFNYEMFTGPASAEDRGTVVDFNEDIGLVLVKWDGNGEVNDHTYGAEQFAYPEYATQFGVVPAE